MLLFMMNASSSTVPSGVFTPRTLDGAARKAGSGREGEGQREAGASAVSPSPTDSPTVPQHCSQQGTGEENPLEVGNTDGGLLTAVLFFSVSA